MKTTEWMPTSSVFGCSVQEFDALLQQAEVLSLDVFDTILLRQCVDPPDAFWIVERKMSEPDFKERRVTAEQAARARFRSGKGIETSLEEIHSLLEVRTEPGSLAEAELAAEAAVLYPNPLMRWVIERARAAGKRVIAITDMYLSSQQVGDLLTANSVRVDAIYSSSDVRDQNLGKYNGSMFEHVCRSEGIAAEAMLHIGDNKVSDVLNPTKKGVLALLAERPDAIAQRRFHHLSQLVAEKRDLSSSLVLGTILRREIEQGPRSHFDAESYGYHFGGPLLAGFLRFMVETSEREGIDRLLLLARDGIVVGKALDIVQPPSLTWRVIPCSRRMAVFPAYEDGGWAAIETLVQDHVGDVRPSELLRRLGLGDVPIPVGMADEPRPLDAVVLDLDDLLRSQARAEKAALMELLADELEARSEGETGFAWVDVGWALTSAKALNRLIRTPAPGFFVGSSKSAEPYEGFRGYLFERGGPTSVADTILSGVELIELIFTHTDPSVLYLESGADGIREKPMAKSGAERVRDVFVADVQRGVLSFMRDIAPFFDLLDADDLKGFNRKVFTRLCETPPQDVHELISSIPHDRVSGGVEWTIVDDYWHPKAVVGSTREVLDSLRRTHGRPIKLMWHHAGVGLLKGLSWLSAPLSSRKARRFANSACKRDPNVLLK